RESLAVDIVVGAVDGGVAVDADELAAAALVAAALAEVLLDPRCQLGRGLGRGLDLGGSFGRQRAGKASAVVRRWLLVHGGRGRGGFGGRVVLAGAPAGGDRGEEG